MIALNAHFDGKVLVPDEPLALKVNQKVRIALEPISPDSAVAPHDHATASLVSGPTIDELDALHIDPLDATPADFVRRPGTAAGQIKMSDDFNITPDDFKDYV